ncbi:hypothetical protein [Kitasatospora sp. NBC_01266]|uniref:hypothetical protein n=1 Tax=Kitasatospora sp. NBC_01266 TaxID=2903572 RepID=UPI002E303603|nr:hypothetical protein [Kitasatospora sp. NBC_01266]
MASGLGTTGASVAAPPSLIVRAGSTTVRVGEAAVLWERGGMVTRIPYGAVGAAVALGGGSLRGRVRVELRGSETVFELRCRAAEAAALAVAVSEQVERVRKLGVTDTPPVTTERAEQAPPRPRRTLRGRFSGRALVWMAVVGCCGVQSAVFFAVGQPAAAGYCWIGVLPLGWSFESGRKVRRLVTTFWRAVTKGVRVEARYDRSAGLGTHEYWYIAPNGARVVHKHTLFYADWKPKPVLTLLLVPGRDDPYSALGAFVWPVIAVPVLSALALGLGLIGLLFVPGMMVSALLG